MIISLLLVPILGVLFLLPIKNNSSNISDKGVVGAYGNNGVNTMKKIALFFSLINFLISIIM
jgi:hypothetical protein